MPKNTRPLPRLLVLGSMDEFSCLVQKARQRNAHVIVADGYDQGPARAFADESYTLDIRNHSEVVRFCLDHQIDALTTAFSDILFESACRAAHAAHIPATCSLEALEFLRNKDCMKQMFRQLEIPHPKSCVTTIENLPEAISELEFPCVIKPLSGYGSYGVHILHSAQDAVEKACQLSKSTPSDTRIVVEEYDTGHEFNMMCWVQEGRVHVLSVADREKTTRGLSEVPHVSRIVYPSRHTRQVIEQATAYAQSIADFLKLYTSPLCLQFFWAPGEQVRLCEVAGRIFGYEHELLEHASGIAIEDLLLDLALGSDSMYDSLANHSALDLSPSCCGVYFHTHGGVLGSIDAAREAFLAAGAREWTLYYNEGDLATEGQGSKPYVARAYLEATTRAELDVLTEQLFSTFSIKDDADNELVLRNEMTN